MVSSGGEYFLATGEHLEDDPVITIAHAKMIKGVIDSTEYVAVAGLLRHRQRGSAVAFYSPLSPRMSRPPKDTPIWASLGSANSCSPDPRDPDLPPITPPLFHATHTGL